jgi:hypothetical protein
MNPPGGAELVKGDEKNEISRMLLIKGQQRFIDIMRPLIKAAFKNKRYIAIQFCDLKIKLLSGCLFDEQLCEKSLYANYMICLLWKKTIEYAKLYSVSMRGPGQVYWEYDNVHRHTPRIELFFPMESSHYNLILEFIKTPAVKNAVILNNACIGYKLFELESLDGLI